MAIYIFVRRERKESTLLKGLVWLFYLIPLIVIKMFF